MGDSKFDGFFAEDAQERFFVKNIERVQGATNGTSSSSASDITRLRMAHFHTGSGH